MESETAEESRDPKQVAHQNSNFKKIMNILSSGCYSQNKDICTLSMKTLSAVVQDISDNPILIKLSQTWIHDYNDQGGCFALNYVVRKHPYLANEYMITILNFT